MIREKMNKFILTTLTLLLMALPSGSWLKAQSAASAEQVRVTGVVTDSQGLPIIGATVVVEGTTTGVVTSTGGEYAIVCAPSGTLAFSFMGYDPMSVSIGGKSRIDVTLTESQTTLDEVIVIGYGTTTRRRTTAAVDQVKAEQIAGRSTASVTQALQGTAPSLVIQNRSFNPNNQQMNINIRGIGTMNNNSPLVVVDGITYEDSDILNRLNQQDIESISILKDAGTAAIYGSRAANGVILVTTKQGKKNQSAVVQFNGMVGVQDPKILFTPIEGYQNAMYKNLALANAGQTPEFTQAEIQDLYDNGNGKFFFDEIMQPALQQNYSIGVSGGWDKGSYMVSGGYFDQRSNFVGPDLGLRRYNFRANVNTERGIFKLGAGIAYTRNNNRQSAADAGNIIADVTRIPTYYYNRQKDPGTGQYLINSMLRQFNSLGLLEKGGYNLFDNDNITLNGSLELKLAKGLKLRGRMGADIVANHRYTRRFQVDFYNPEDMSAPPIPANTNRDSEDWSEKSWLVNMDLVAEYDYTSCGHHITAMVGGVNESYQRQRHQMRYINGEPILGIKGDVAGGFLVDLSGDAPGASYLTPESTTRRGLTSVIGRAGYDYRDKYFIEGSFRYDGSSKFASENRWGFFPSASVAWRLSEENFMEQWRNRMGELKLRASLGTLGNQNVNDYQYFTTWEPQTNSYAFNNVSVNGYGFRIASDELRWETTRTWNIGLDASFFKNSLNITFDYFVRDTYDILVPPAIALMNGTAPQDWNAGEMRTQGWEVTANYLLRTGKVNHAFNLNFGDSRNEVTRYNVYERIEHQEELWHITRIGLPFRSYYGYKVDGYFQTQAEANAAAQFSGQQFQAGDARFVDRNGDGVLNANDWYYLGNAFPRYTFGFNYSLNWKGFDFGLLLQGVLKRTMNVRGELIEPFHETYGGTMYKHNLDFWTPTNTHATWPRLAKDNIAYRKDYGSDLFLFNGAYMRVKNIQLGYTIPQQITGKLGISKLRLYVNAQNPLTFSAVSFVDPESSEFNSNMSGVGNSARNYPPIRYWGGGLDITF